MKIKASILSLLFAQTLVAQNIPAGSLTPVIGETFLMHSIDVSAASPILMDHCFDFSSFTMNPFDITHNIVNPSTTTYGLYYPTSTYCVEAFGSDYFYYSGSATGIVQNGYYIFGTQMIYTDPRKIMQYPLGLSGSFSDNYLGYYTNPSFQCYKRTGTMNVQWYDSGTLITSQGSFNNIAQIKTVEQFDDVEISCFDSTEIGISDNTQNITYEYFELGRHYPLIRVDIVGPMGSEYLVGKQLLVNNLGTETGNENPWIIFYNSIGIHIQTTGVHQMVHGKLMDMSGKIVHEFTEMTSAVDIDLSTISKGVYLLEMRSENMQHSFKVIK